MEFEFDADDFLADRVAELERNIRHTYEDLFRGAAEINRECHILLFSPCISRDDGRAVLTATLFMRSLEHYQATIILLRKSTIAAARVTLRALVDATFRLRAVATSDDTWKTFILEDQAYRIKIINKGRQTPYRNLEETRTAATDEIYEALKAENKATGARVLSMEEWSTLAGMRD
jgi:hypothetical protein